MRKVCVLVCCVFIFIAMVMTSVDSRTTREKKNKPPSKKDLSEDNSDKSDSDEKLVPDKTPKMKPLPNKKDKKKPDKKIQYDSTKTPVITAKNIGIQNDPTETPDITVKNIDIQNDSTEIPVITAKNIDIDFLPGTVKPPDARDLLQTTLTVPQNCSATASKSDKLEKIERNVTSLWRHLSVISQPVHVHIHGGHVSSPGCHGNGGRHADHSHKGHQHQHKDRNQLSDKHKYHGLSHNDSRDHSHGHARNRSHDHSHSPSHSHAQDHAHNTTTSHKHHTVGSHSHSHQGHGDRSHKSHDHSKHHSHGRKFARGHDHSLSKGHYHKGGYGYGDRSTHVHIHLTIDGQLPPVHREVNESESTSIPPITNDTHTHTPEQVFARCDFLKHKGNQNLSGYVLLRERAGVLDVAVNISGFHVSETDAAHPGPSTHGFHVHEFGDFSNGCLSFASHYNPEGTTHGGLHHQTRHVGDWGNIQANDQGEAVTYFSVSDAKLKGPHSILGRGIVVHELADDLGEGGVPASLTTGNAGGRLTCCIIGISKPLPDESFQQPTVDPPDPTPEIQLTPGS